MIIRKFYGLACVYSKVGDSSNAVKYLRKLRSLWKKENNRSAFKCLREIEHDRDFDPIRSNDDFKNVLIKVKLNSE
ncbi:MAG: hypothetical protein GY754_37140 [bacterium]|nr:hypothetical protein [bacterium]